MDITTAKQVIEVFWESNVPLHVWGGGGVGKSSVIEELAEKKGYCLVDLRLATQEVGDLIGIPYHVTEEKDTCIGKDGEGTSLFEKRKSTVTRWAKPYWFSDIEDAYSRGVRSVIFMDEMDRAQKEVIQAVYQLVLKKRLHEHLLPDNTIIIAAGNPPTDEYMVDTFDTAMATRWGHIFIDPSVNAWLDGFGPKCSLDVTGFIASTKDVLCYKAKAWEVDSITKPTPRGWEFVDRIFRTLGSDDMIKLQLCVSAIIGAHAASQFISSFAADVIRVEDVLGGKKTIDNFKEPVQLIRIANELGRYTTFSDLNKSGKASQKELDTRKERLGTFMVGLLTAKKELAIAVLKGIANRDNKLMNKIILNNSQIGQVVTDISRQANQIGGTTY